MAPFLWPECQDSRDMSTADSTQREELTKAVSDALGRAEAHCGKFRPWDTRLSVMSIACGAIATVLAGGAVAGGKPALDAFGGWKILCTIVALFTAAATASSSLHKSLQISNRVANAERCIARLRALEAGLRASELPVHEALRTFQLISEEHAGCLC